MTMFNFRLFAYSLHRMLSILHAFPLRTLQFCIHAKKMYCLARYCSMRIKPRRHPLLSPPIWWLNMITFNGTTSSATKKVGILIAECNSWVCFISYILTTSLCNVHVYREEAPDVVIIYALGWQLWYYGDITSMITTMTMMMMFAQMKKWIRFFIMSTCRWS